MTAPVVTFEKLPNEALFVKLGAIEVGLIEVRPGGANWRLFLPPSRLSQAFRAPSVEAAKEAARNKVEQWVEAAGLRG